MKTQEKINEKIYKPIKAYNDHQNCKGHANVLLDSTYETKEEVELIKKVIDNYI